MSGSSKRRHSKWDHKDSEVVSENFYDRAPTRRPRELISPGRGSRRHDSRSKESSMTWDREGNCSRISPGLDEWRPRHSSRSPRNGWGRSHRISKSRSRSRSRSQSPAHNFRREPTINDRSRSRSGVSVQICRDFASGRCRRGSSCNFLHPEDMYDIRRVECSSPEDWESRRRRTGGSRYSPDDTKDSAIRIEKSAHICNEFLKGRCRRGGSCRYVHDDSGTDVFEKEPVEDVYRKRDHDIRSRDIYHDHEHRTRDTYRDLDHRRRDIYPDRNYEYEPTKRGETPCKFFAAGNCRNGTRCKFSHQVQENFSPDRRSRADRRGPDNKVEGGQVWDGPRWSDATTVSTVPAVQVWGEDKNEKKEVNTIRSQGDKRGPDHKYEGDRVWDGPSWSDATIVSTVPGVQGWGEDKNEKKEVNTTRSQGDKRGPDHKYEGDRVWDGPRWSDATTVSMVPAAQGWGEDENEKKEVNTPRSQGDKRGPDHKYEGYRGWDGPSWSDVTPVPDVPVVHGWGDEKNEITEVAKDVNRARPGDDCWSHEMLDIKQVRDTTNTIIKPQIQDKEQPLQWKIENNIPGMGLSASRNIEFFSGDMEISPRDVKQQGVNSSTSQTPSISNISFPAAQQDVAGKASYDKHYQAGFQEQKVLHDPFAEQISNYKDNKPILYSGERRDVIGDNGGSCIVQNQPKLVSQGQGIFQHDQSVDAYPISNINHPTGQGRPPIRSQPPGQIQLSFPSHPPPGQSQLSLQSHPPLVQNQLPLPPHSSGQSELPLPSISHPPPVQTPLSLPLSSHPPPVQNQLPLPSHPPPGQNQFSHPSRGETMQVSHNPPSFSDNKVADGSHVISLASSSLAPESSTARGKVSNEQLLSHLTASLTQLLESRQQLSQLSSTVTPHGLSNLPDLAAPVSAVSGAIIQPDQALEVSKPYDPVPNSIEPKVHNLGNHLLPIVEQKTSNNELHNQATNEIHYGGGKVIQQEPLASSKGEKNGKTTVEGGIKAPENGPSQDVGPDDGADDDKKMKDTKGLRAFKFALAEFVKELLKPSWKDGQVSKEVYKTIVKKVVDKVVETLGPQIPQTKEKIDLYLSCSKQKIEKLVQAYRGKHQKS